VPRSGSSPSSKRAAERARAQLLQRPRGLTAADVVERLLAVQAQDARALPLALRARGADLGDGEALAITWLMRGTLHLVRREDVHWLLALTAPRQVAGNRRRLLRLGIGEAVAERAVRLMRDALADRGPLPRAVLADMLRERDIPVAGQAIAHLTHRAALAGAIALGVDRAFVLLDWPPGPEGDLGARYRAAHPHATPADLARWSGLPLGVARAALRDAHEPTWRAGPVPVRLLGAFDELLLGYRDRTPTLAAEHERHVYPGGGILRPVVIEDGVVKATWRLRAGEVAIEPFADIADQAGLAAEIAAIAGASSSRP
jgi:hypothetical protein